MRKRRIRTWIVGLVLAALVGLTVFSGSDNVSSDDVLLRGNSGEPSTLDPHLVQNSAEFIIVNDLFVGLFSQAADGSVIPGIAESHTVSEDGLVWTFNLREGLQWSDGVALTSEDVLYSFRRALTPETAASQASMLYAIKNAEAANSGAMEPDQIGVTAPDARTIVIELERPTPYFDRMLLTSAAMPVPRHAIEEHGRSWARPPNAVSNGAFVLSSWSPRVYVEALRNPRFYEVDTVRLEGVRYIPTEDLDTQLKRFRAGELDLGLNFPPSQADWVRTNLKDEVRIFPIYGTYIYAMNTEAEAFTDPRVREALAIAIDRSTITDRLLGSGEQPAYSIVPPGFENYPGPTKPAYADQSLDERRTLARQLLAQAGHDDGNPLTFELRYNMTEEHQMIAVAIADMWRTIGVEASLLSTEARTHFRDLASGEYQIGRAALFANYADPRAFLATFFTDDRNNYSSFTNGGFDRLLLESDGILNPQDRAAKMQEAELVAMEQFPVIPLYHYVSKRLVSRRVQGWENNPVGTHLSRYLWLEEPQ